MDAATREVSCTFSQPLLEAAVLKASDRGFDLIFQMNQTSSDYHQPVLDSYRHIC